MSNVDIHNTTDNINDNNTNSSLEKDTVDNTDSDTIKEGWLWKKHQKAQLWSGWHKRYFILRKSGSILLYYRNPNTSKCRGKIELGTNSDISFRGRKDATAHRRELYQFMVQCPVLTGSSMFLLGSPTEEEANSWLKALKNVAANSRKTVGETNHDIGALTDYEDSEEEEDEKNNNNNNNNEYDRRNHNNSFFSSTRLNTPGGSNRKNSVGRSKIIKESFLYRRNPHPPLIPKAPFYALGWNKRLFCLDSIGRLEWFKVDFRSNKSGSHRGIGSLLLGGDCRVEFPATPRRTNKQQSFFPFTIFAGKKKLELGGPTLEEAVSWVQVIEKCIERTKSEVGGTALTTVGGSRSNSDDDEGFHIQRGESVLVESDIDQDELFVASEDQSDSLQGMLYKKFVSKDVLKLSRGWHTRYFVLEGDRMEYFLTSRSTKRRGTVFLGPDCRVDFQGKPLKRGGREMYCFTLFAENFDSTGRSALVDGALLLGTPSLDHAETWVNALRKAIHMVPQNEKIKRALSLVEDVDEEDDNDDDDELLAVSPQNNRFHRASQPLHYGDKLRFWTRSAYLDSNHPGDFIGVYLRKKKMVGGRLFAVRPAGKRSDLPIVTSTFVVQDPLRTKGKDIEVYYGDPVVLVDDDGLVWTYCQGYIGPRSRSEHGELVLTFHRSEAGCRDGDPVCYRDTAVSLHDWTRKREIGNFKKSSSKLEGGYLYAGPQAKKLLFEIRESGRTASDSNDSSAFFNSQSIGGVMASSSIDEETTTFAFHIMREGERHRRPLGWNVKLNTWVNIGFIGSLDVIEVTSKFLDNLHFQSTPPQLPATAKIGYTISQQLNSKTSTVLIWRLEPKHKKGRNRFMTLEFLIESVWYILPIFAAYVAMQYGLLEYFALDTSGTIDGLIYVVLYIAAVATGCYITANILRYSILGGKKSNDINHEDDQKWSVLIEQNLQQRNRRPSEWMPNSPSTPMTSNKGESGLSRMPELNISDEFKDGVEEGSFKKVMFGKSMTFDDKIAMATTTSDVPERVWGTIPSTNFELRVGPNYAWNKKKEQAPPAFYDPVGMDFFLSPKKLRTMVDSYEFDLKIQKQFLIGHEKIVALGLQDEIPAVICLVSGFPNIPPANPLWGQKVTDGETHTFCHMHVVSDVLINIIKEGNGNTGPLGLWRKYLAVIEKGDMEDPFLDRLKQMQSMINPMDVGLSQFALSLHRKYNGKPLLTRPQHYFHRKEIILDKLNNTKVYCMEIAIDVWGWNYLVRQAVFDHIDRSHLLIVDWWLCIESQADEEMPETPLFCLRVANTRCINPSTMWEGQYIPAEIVDEQYSGKKR